MEESSRNKETAVNDKILKDVAGMLRAMRFGQVVITVHNGCIVQMDRIEKTRYADSRIMTAGKGI